MKVQANEPYVLPHDVGVQDVWFPYPGTMLGRYSIKAMASQTRGRLSQVHVVDDRGAAAPVHIHHDFDETYYVIDGEMSFFLGDEQIDAGPGSYTFIPQGTPHAFVVRSDRAEFLLTFAPGGLERFFVENGIPVVAGGPKPDPIVTDPEEMARKALPFGAEIVGPPPMPS